jgi:tRNA A-37 threonylcarbamoyl transferase component Bud32
MSDTPLPETQALWEWPGVPVEAPNTGRGGRSEVLRIELPGALGYLKRQRGHTTRSWRAPLRGEPTLAREVRMLRAAARAGVGTPALLTFATGPGRGALLLTVALEGYAPPDAALSAMARRAQLRAAARALARLHGGWLQHGALYPKHLLLGLAPDGYDVRILDFEKARRRPPPLAARRDLDSLNRHAHGYSRTDRLRFLLAYRGEARLSWGGRRLWRALARRALEARG